jgi:hypothetical protein
VGRAPTLCRSADLKRRLAVVECFDQVYALRDQVSLGVVLAGHAPEVESGYKTFFKARNFEPADSVCSALHDLEAH